LWNETAVEKLPSDQRDGTLINAAFETVLSRRPTREEGVACRRFLQTQAGLYEKGPPLSFGSGPKPEVKERPLVGLIHALFNHNDFVTFR